MKYYKTCKDLLLYNFFEILDTKNYKWLIKGYDGEDVEVDLKTLEVLWKNIFDEYIQLKADENSKDYYRTIAEVDILEYKLFRLDLLIYCYGIVDEKTLTIGVCKELSELGFPVDQNKSKKSEFDRLKRNRNALMTKINHVKGKNKKIFEKQEKEIKVNRFRQIANIEKLTDRKINTKEVVVGMFIEYEREAIAEYNRRKENAGRKG